MRPESFPETKGFGRQIPGSTKLGRRPRCSRCDHRRRNCGTRRQRPIGLSIVARIRHGSCETADRFLCVRSSPAQRQRPSKSTDRRAKGEAGRVAEKAARCHSVFGLVHKRYQGALIPGPGIRTRSLIGKRSGSKYEAGKRTGAWVKIKLHQEQEFVIGCYTEPEGSRKYFRRLAGWLLRRQGFQVCRQSRNRFQRQASALAL